MRRAPANRLPSAFRNCWNEPCWLTLEDVFSPQLYDRHGDGRALAVLNADGLASAVARPRNHFLYEDEDDALSLAVTLLFGLARNHAFQTGQ